MRINLAIIAACTVMGLTGMSATSTQAASGMCNIFNNPWPTLQDSDGNPGALNTHDPACATTNKSATSVVQPNRMKQSAQHKVKVPATSAHS